MRQEAELLRVAHVGKSDARRCTSGGEAVTWYDTGASSFFVPSSKARSPE